MSLSAMVHFTLSPNEEARILKEERDKRKKERIKQVREQEKLNAAKRLQSVKNRKDELAEEITKQLKAKWDAEQQEELEKLNAAYKQKLQGLGEGHQNAVDENCEWVEECRHQAEREERWRAEERHQVALQRHRNELEERQTDEQKHIAMRLMALDVEKSRAQKIASLPKPKPNPVDAIEPLKVRPVKFTDYNAFSSSHYHIPEAIIEKENCQTQVDAKSVAAEEDERYREVGEERKRTLHEQTERARLRHKEAVKKEHLKHEYSRLMHELSDLQRADFNRRRQAVEKLPKQIFLAPHRRVEEKDEVQVNMERAFEDMFMAATDFTGDLSLALDQRPSVPASADLSSNELVPGDREPTADDLNSASHADQRHSFLEHYSPGAKSMLVERPLEQMENRNISASSVSLIASKKANLLQKLQQTIQAQRDERLQKQVHEDSSEMQMKKETESVAEPKFLRQLTMSSADDDDDPPRPAAVRKFSGSTYTITTKPDIRFQAMEFSTPSVADNSCDHLRHSTHRNGTSLLSSGSSRVTPSLAESHLLSDESSFIEHSQERTTASEMNGGIRGLTEQEIAIRRQIILRQAEIEQERKKVEDQLKMIEERKRALQQKQHLLNGRSTESGPMEKTILAEYRSQPSAGETTVALSDHSETFRPGKPEEVAKFTAGYELQGYLGDRSGASIAVQRPQNESYLPQAPSAGEAGLAKDAVRQYQERLLTRQSDPISALAQARQHLQLRSEALLHWNTLPVNGYPSDLPNSSFSQESVDDQSRSSIYGNELSTIFEASHNLDSSSHPRQKLDRYVSPPENVSDLAIRDLLARLAMPYSSSLNLHRAVESPVTFAEPVYRHPTYQHLQTVPDIRDFTRGGYLNNWVGNSLSGSIEHRGSDEALDEPVRTELTGGSHIENLNSFGLGDGVRLGQLDQSDVASGSDFDLRSDDKATFKTVHLQSVDVLDDPSKQILRESSNGAQGTAGPTSLSRLENSQSYDIRQVGGGSVDGLEIKDLRIHQLEASDRRFQDEAEIRDTGDDGTSCPPHGNFIQHDAAYDDVRQFSLTNESVAVESDISVLSASGTPQNCPDKGRNESFPDEDMLQLGGIYDRNRPHDLYKASAENSNRLQFPEFQSINQQFTSNLLRSLVNDKGEESTSELPQKGIDLHNLPGFMGSMERAFGFVFNPDISGETNHGQANKEKLQVFPDQNPLKFVHGREFHGESLRDEAFQGITINGTSTSDRDLPSKSVLDQALIASGSDRPSSVLQGLECLEGQVPSGVADVFVAEDQQPAARLITVSGNVYKEWRPLIPDVSQEFSGETQSGSSVLYAEQRIRDGKQEGRPVFNDEELMYRDESVKAGDVCFQLASGIHAFHTIPARISLADGKEPWDEDSNISAFSEDMTDSSLHASAKLRQFRLPSMQSTLIEDADRPTKAETISYQHTLTELSQHPILDSLNSPVLTNGTSNSRSAVGCSITDSSEVQDSAQVEEVHQVGAQQQLSSVDPTQSERISILPTTSSATLPTHSDCNGISTASSWSRNMISKDNESVYDASKYISSSLRSESPQEKHQKFEVKISKRIEDLSGRLKELPNQLSSDFVYQESETGILDEPDLTLVSADSTLLSVRGAMSESSSPANKNPSLLSFERHELSALDSLSRESTAASPLSGKFSSKHENYASGQSQSSVTLAELENKVDAGSLSLQDAFLAKRKDFVEKSKQRVEDAKEKAKTKPTVEEKQLAKRQILAKTVSDFIKNRAVGVKPTDSRSLTDTSSGEDRRLSEKEMKDRTARLYNQLEEVKIRKEEEDRRTFYAQNREKRKDYEKNLNSQLKKKQSSK